MSEFASIAAADISFRSLTVGEFMERIDDRSSDSKWVSYIRDRYLAPSGLLIVLVV